MAFNNAYQGKTVLLTGHTGFKGAWLVEWLLGLGARVVGYALNPPTEPSLFAQLDLAALLAEDIRADVRDLASLVDTVRRVQPDFVFHLAAQPLVRLSYVDPVGTFETNVNGSVNVMEAVRREAKKPCAVVMVTTDKCYENREWLHAYREEDPMGGHDPYSASKGCAELAVASYRRSFFAKTLHAGHGGTPIALASARAGNVIGGGDWAADRIVPDCVRALRGGQAIPVRNKTSTRPWQHVLEPLSGYLLLGQQISESLVARDAAALDRLCAPFNFGPNLSSNRTVAELVEEVLRCWPGKWLDQSDPHAPHEAGRLNLTIDKAFHLLHWAPVWPFAETLAATVAWYRQAEDLPADGANAFGELTRGQIAAYAQAANHLGIAWASDQSSVSAAAAAAR